MAQIINLNKRRIKMTGLEFIEIDDNGEIYECITRIQIEFVSEGYMKIPDVEYLSEKMRDLILGEGYGDVDIEDIAKESAEILGMRLKK
jgi:hypothetical protein